LFNIIIQVTRKRFVAENAFRFAWAEFDAVGMLRNILRKLTKINSLAARAAAFQINLLGNGQGCQMDKLNLLFLVFAGLFYISFSGKLRAKVDWTKRISCRLSCLCASPILCNDGLNWLWLLQLENGQKITKSSFGNGTELPTMSQNAMTPSIMFIFTDALGATL
jgi:hypothetical protein